MVPEDFIRNNRKINDGGDLDEGFQRQIFSSIKRSAFFISLFEFELQSSDRNVLFGSIHSSEIVMPEEREGELGESYAWKKLLRMDALLGNSILFFT